MIAGRLTELNGVSIVVANRNKKPMHFAARSLIDGDYEV